MQIPIRPLPVRLLTCSLAASGCAKLAAISTTIEFRPNHLIFRMHDGPAAMWLITRGKVFVSRSASGLFSESFGRGIFGLTETIAAIPYGESLVADSYCSCERVDRAALLELLSDENGACSALLSGLSRNYIRGVQQLASELN